MKLLLLQLTRKVFVTAIFLFAISTCVLSQYNGPHYVGSEEEFKTITEAVDSLKSQGVNGATTIIVKPGNYHEQVSITAIEGASEVNTITFQSENKIPDEVMIYWDATSNSSNNYVIQFNACSFVTFEYFKIVNSTLNSGYTSVINIYGAAENNTIRHNTLIGESGSPSGNSEAVIIMYDGILNNMEFSQNLIQGGSWVIRFDMYGVDAGKTGLNTRFNYNTCNSRLGIYLEVQNGIEIIGNELNTASGNGISLYSCEEAITITNNKLNCWSSAGYKGMYFDNCDGSIAFQGLIANNVIRIGGEDSDDNFGIHLLNSNYQNVYHNTVFIAHTSYNGFAFYVEGGNNVVVKNNLFTVANYGYAYGSSGSGNISVSDFNNYYTSGNYIAKWNGGNIEELSNLQAVNGKDASSKACFPSYVADSEISGLIPQTHWLDGIGDNLTGIIDFDIDNVSRPVSPDVGAYEYTPTYSTPYVGNLTIGGGGTFPSFTVAIDSLKKNGVSGPVTIDVESNLYNEQISVPAIPGVDATNTLTFQSAAGDSTQVVMQYSASSSSDNYVVFLNGADYITFKHMTFKSTGATYARIFRLNGRARDITISNNILDGNGNPAGSTNMAPITSFEDNADYLTITNNVIKDGDRGIQLEGASTSDKSNGVVIAHNQFPVGHELNVYLKWHTDFEINNNTFQNFTNTGTYIHECTSPYHIKNNEFSSTAVKERGIYVNNCDGTGDGGLIYNNFIHVENSADIRGIWIYNSWYQSFYNNSINVISNNSGSRGIEYEAYSNNGSNMIYKNNNIAVVGPGYPFCIESANTSVAESDNNNLYTNGAYIANWTNGASTNYNAVNHTDIASLTAYSGKDANSQNFNPSYFSDSDLHTNSYWLDGKGTQILGIITDDIDGESRLNPPDIGADEYISTAIPYDGEYTIGTSGRFSTFSEAVDSLIERGILDTVIFKVQDGYYSEQFVIPQIAGVSSDAVIIFESESGNADGVTLTFNPTSSKNYIVKFDGADYITFRNMSFQSGTDQYARIISFSSKCENINLTGNKFSGRGESSAGSEDAIFYTNGGIVNNLTVTNNSFANGSTGIWMLNSSSSTGINLQITDNTFSSFSQGVYIKYFAGPKIESNIISFNLASGMGINIQECSSGVTFGMSVRNNQIYSDTYANDHGALYFYNCDANPTFPGIIANNVVRIGVNGTRSLGIDMRESDYLSIYYNTVNITGNETNDIAFYSYNSNYINIINNNFVIKGDVEDKTSSHGYAIYVASGTIGNCDYNNYYSAGKYLANWGGSDYGTLAELQAGNGKDAHSINYFPGFRGTNNLTMKSSWLDGKGSHLESVSEDIDGLPRDESTPDIGAYEYTSTLLPIPGGTYTVAALGGDYPSLDSLVKALMERGIGGSVTFELMPGTYPNTNFTIKDIPGVSLTDTVVIQSQSGDPGNTFVSHTQESGYNYILRFEGTDYVTIQNLTFNSGGTDYTRIFVLQGNSQHMNIIGNVLNGVSTVYGDATNESLIYVPSDQIVDNLLIKGNTFTDNSYGIYFYGNYNIGYNHTNLKVVENVFNNQYVNIEFYRTKRPYIFGNTIDGGLQYGIYLRECDNDLVVLNNKIFVSDDSYYAIYLHYCDGSSANKGLIANNFVSVHGAGGSYGSFGIKLDVSNYQLVYHNTLKTTGNKGACFNTYQGGNLQIANNVFVNEGTTTYAYTVNHAYAIAASDYNDFYSTGTNYIQYDGTEYSALADYQSGATMDLNSVDYNPVLTSDTDFHLLADSVVGIAAPLTSFVPFDIDGETRNVSNPDMGADEFSCLFFPKPNSKDIVVCSTDTIPPLYAEGSNIEWYADKELTQPLFSANEYNTGKTEPGVYSYWVTQSLGECTSDADSVSLTILQAPLLSADITNIDCEGADFGTINLNVTGGQGPYIYDWSNGEMVQDITKLEEGRYWVKVEDLQNCISVDTFEISAPVPLILDLLTEDTECSKNYGKATVVASGGEEPYNYQWTSGHDGTVADSLESGIYIVTVIDNKGCSEFAIATINDIGGPVIELDNISDVSCYGGADGAISTSVTGGATPYVITWSNGATGSDDVVDIAAGSYELEVIDNSGCKAIASMTVEEPEPLFIDLDIVESACGQANGSVTANVSGGNAPYNYLWDVGGNENVIDNLDIGAYSLKVTDNNACEATKHFAISEVGAPTVVVDSIIEGTCGNADGAIYISVYGVYETYNYLWSTGADTEDLIGVNPGDYDVTVSDEGGCKAVQVASIEADQPLMNSICMVSVDSATNYNEVIWEKEVYEGVDYYNIYKESSQSDNYFLIGSVDLNEESIFVDTLSNPLQRSWRYKMSVVDICGVESEISENHKTMHLTINLGINNTINLIWDHYEGFDYETYYIYRLAEGEWAKIDSVPSNLTSYTDENPPEGELFYMIEILHPFGCDIEKKAGRKKSSRSNVSNPVLNSPPPPPPPPGMEYEFGQIFTRIDIYPNPNEGKYFIDLETLRKEAVWYTVYSSSGDIIEQRFIGEISGDHIQEVDISTQSAGVYFVKVYSANNFIVKKIILNK